ncbi:uncharacterized protein BBA_06799 [Beauveria bassiana ARSEF 2860]|uniref:Proteophosphoglycan ppg4 n=1 Tax=Beauveria bassiana (strain ARSEF 2860) TaxID=655819 RepID=J4UK34_BEAB2|nr:uncharacterized protein BBA_06799 [Beauveria bassiana ARSEF 2860]EJP64417.1 hypothetical protein BBA_06799 [Beauveria bassiana ARSEF 2860]
MGNASSSCEEPRAPYRRRLSKHRATSSWVQSAGASDSFGMPTTPMGSAYHELDDAIPTVPNFAMLQSRDLSSIKQAKNIHTLGHDLSAAAGCYKSRPSRHSTDAFHPLRSAPVSGSARAASMKEDDELGNDAENQRLDDIYFSSPPGLSSSSSTESGRTLSSDSDTSRELPLYIPYRRRSLQRIPGLATRPEKFESDATIHRQNLPTLSANQSYCPSVQSDNDAATFLVSPIQDQDLDDLGNPAETGFKQLGSIRFGSLRITNGSPLSMRQGEAKMDGSAVSGSDSIDKSTASGEGIDSNRALPAISHAIEDSNDSTSIEQLTAIAPDCPPEGSLQKVPVSETVRGRQGRLSTENSRASAETVRARIPSFIDVVGDEQLNLVRRQSRRVTSDDSSSVYSDNFIPVMIADDIASHKATHNDNSNGPHLSFQSFRNLIRQNRVKSYLQANNKTAVTNKSSHQRSASEQSASTTTSTIRSQSRPRHKLGKKKPRALSPPATSASKANNDETDATTPWPVPPGASNRESAAKKDKVHARRKSDRQVHRTRPSQDETPSVPRAPRQLEHTLRDRFNEYQTTSERVPILLDRASATPRGQVSFERDIPKQRQAPVRAEQLRRSQTAEFKPLPTPKPELPQRRRPVKVPAPTPNGFGAQSFQENPQEPRNRQSMFSPMPSHVRSHTAPLMAHQYRPYHHDDKERRLQSLESDSPYVSPMSDDGQVTWPLTVNEALSRTAPRSSTFQPREVSPLRQTVSMPSIHGDDDNRSLLTPAPISAHSRRAQELAEKWNRQQQKKQSSRTSLEQSRLSELYEQLPSRRPTLAGAVEEDDEFPFVLVERDDNLPPIVYRNGTRRGSEVSMWRPPYRVLHSYYSPAYRNAPIWG